MDQIRKSYTLPTILWLIIFFPVGLILMWSKTQWSKSTKWIVTVFFGVIILLSAIGSNTPTNKAETKVVAATVTNNPTMISTPTISPTPKPTVTPVPKDSNGFPEDSEAVTVSDIDKSPSKYEGKKITFTCTVAGFAKDSSGNAAAVNCSDPNDFSSLIQVDTSAFDMTKINQDDTVRFYGMGMGSASGKNAFGGDVSESLVFGIYINDITSGYTQ